MLQHKAFTATHRRPAARSARRRCVTLVKAAAGQPGAVNSSSAVNSSEYEALRGIKVVSAADGFEVDLLSLWQPGDVVAVPFLTHFADLSSWEYAQKLQQKGLPRLQDLGVKVVTVGLGSAENARFFSQTLDYPLEGLYADPTGACYKALGFSPGFAPESGINPYVKLLTMLAGIGSPGTVQEVLRGYVGDRGAKPVFQGSTPFDILGTGYQRPFELATLRLFNMVGILPKWGELSPPDPNLLVQQGGTLLLRGGETLWRHDDSGILKYTDIDALLAAAEEAAAGGLGGQQQQALQAQAQRGGP